MTILWLIERLIVKPIEGSNPDVVITANWRCNGTDETYSGTCYGSCLFAPPTGSFTPYEDLTQDQVLQWCYANGVDKTAIEATVSIQIQNQINPPVVCLPLPWVPTLKQGDSLEGQPSEVINIAELVMEREWLFGLKANDKR